MPSLLASINLFPETRMWRFKKQPQLNSNCGGIATILIIAIIIAILVVEFNNVFKRTKTTVTHEKVASPGQYSVLTTSKENPNNKQIMIAVNMENINSFDFTTYQNQSNQVFTADTCTRNHFSNDSNTQAFLNQYNLSTWKCFPLNQEYEIGGVQNTNKGKFIDLLLFCPFGNCSTSYGFRNILIQTSLSNPYNHNQQWQNQIKEIPFSILPNTSQYHELSFVENIINDDQSLFPFQNQKTVTRGYQLSDFRRGYEILNTTEFHQLSFFRASHKEVFTIRYFRVLDALAYVGGFFNIILALFFLVKWYGVFLFELFLANIFFQTDTFESLHFFSYFKQVVYEMLLMCNIKPDWQKQIKRSEYTNTIQKLMDVVYLQQRIEFLEKSLEILLDKHQIKGLHLLRRLKRKQVDQKYQHHLFRDKLLYYFKKKKQKGEEQRQTEKKQQLRSDEILLEKKQTKLNREDQQLEKRDSFQKLSPQKFEEKRKSKEMLARPNEREKEEKKLDESSRPLNAEEDLAAGRQLEPQLEEEPDQGELSLEMEEELQNDLKILIQEADRGDEMSRKIVERIDYRLVEFLRRSIREERRISYLEIVLF